MQVQLQVVRVRIDVGRERVREEAIVGARTTLDASTPLVDALSNDYVADYTVVSAIGGLTAAGQDLTVVAYDTDMRYDENNARFFGYEHTEDTVWEEIWLL